MKLLTGLIIGLTLMTLLHILGWPLIGWVLTRNPPATPDGWEPRHRTWQNGIEQ